MSDSQAIANASTWEDQIRALENESCAAFLAADITALKQLWSDDFVVNSPLQRVASRDQVLALLQSGRIRHASMDYEIEHVSRRGDVVIVMGSDCVTDPPDGALSRRRFTNVWRLEDGKWRMVARHAHVVSREPGPAAG